MDKKACNNENLTAFDIISSSRAQDITAVEKVKLPYHFIYNVYLKNACFTSRLHKIRIYIYIYIREEMER